MKFGIIFATICQYFYLDYLLFWIYFSIYMYMYSPNKNLALSTVFDNLQMHVWIVDGIEVVVSICNLYFTD